MVQNEATCDMELGQEWSAMRLYMCDMELGEGWSRMRLYMTWNWDKSSLE